MSPRVAGNLAGIAGMLVWASGFPAAAEILATWHPLLLTPVRMGIAAGVLLALLAAFGRLGELRQAPLAPQILFGVLLGLSGICMVSGQRYAHPVSVAIIVSGMPAVSAAMGAARGQERITAPLVLGVALAFAGGILTSLASGAAASPAAAPIPGLGELFVFASVVCYVGYTRMTIARLHRLGDLARTAVTTAWAALATLPVAGIAWSLGLVDRSVDVAPRTLLLILWLGGAAIGIGTWLWFVSSRHLGVTVASVHNNLVPFYVMLFALMAGAPVHGNQVWGALLVIAGAVLAQLPLYRGDPAKAGIRS